MEIVYLNGVYLPANEAYVSVFDRGFLYGDSVYEVVPFYQGVGFRLEEHLERLSYSLSQVGIVTELDFAGILNDLVELNGGGNQSAYLQISRGNSGERRTEFHSDMAPTVFACCRKIEDNYSRVVEEVLPIDVVVLPDQRDLHCDIKSTCLQPNILTYRQAQLQGASEAIQLRDGFLTEGTSSNVFIVKKGELYTPALGEKILGGITRQLVVELAEKHAIPCHQCNLTYQQLIEADEVWISSSTRAIVPVTKVDDHRVADGRPGPLWRTMFQLFTQYQQQLMMGLKND